MLFKVRILVEEHKLHSLLKYKSSLGVAPWFAAVRISLITTVVVDMKQIAPQFVGVRIVVEKAGLHRLLIVHEV